jgi:hypothetical protein
VPAQLKVEKLCEKPLLVTTWWTARREKFTSQPWRSTVPLVTFVAKEHSLLASNQRRSELGTKASPSVDQARACRRMRRFSARNRRAILEARRRAEAARRAAIARQMALDKAMRDEVQAFIAKDDLTGEDPEVRRVAVMRSAITRAQ